MKDVFVNWLISLCFGIPTLLMVYTLSRKTMLSEKSDDKKTFLIRHATISQSWYTMLILFIMGSIYDFFIADNVTQNYFQSFLYLSTGLIIYALSYLLNRRRYS